MQTYNWSMSISHRLTTNTTFIIQKSQHVFQNKLSNKSIFFMHLSKTCGLIWSSLTIKKKKKLYVEVQTHLAKSLVTQLGLFVFIYEENQYSNIHSSSY
jgi:hypothetical protein